MTEILLIRHAPTNWNMEKRLQGLSDIPLSDHSIKWLKTWQIPKYFKDFICYSSPLIRARTTASLITDDNKISICDSLIEMSFGDWEGQKIADLRKKLGIEMQKNEDKGLDFTPINGESPRMVQNRLLPLLKKIIKNQQNSILVSHHGVMRAIMALAYDWNMLGKPPFKFKQGHGYLFKLDHDKNNVKLSPVEIHIPLTDVTLTNSKIIK